MKVLLHLINSSIMSQQLFSLVFSSDLGTESRICLHTVKNFVFWCILFYISIIVNVNISPHSFVSVGPRLSSFLLDQSDDTLAVDDFMRYLPISSHQTLQLCSYPLHELTTNLLQQLPPNVIFQEYAIKVNIISHFFVCILEFQILLMKALEMSLMRLEQSR